MGDTMTTELEKTDEFKPGEFRVVAIGEITTSSGDTIKGAIVEFPAGAPPGMTWGDIWDGKAFQIAAAPPPPAGDVKPAVARDEIEHALRAVIAATRAYLPPDGIDAQECINRILSATDNPLINSALSRLEQNQ